MSEFRTIYLDMDGVLADFDGHFEKLYGAKPSEYEEKHGQSEFWRRIYMTPTYFRDMPRTPWAHSVIDFAIKNSKEYCILSSPSRTNISLCIQQKREWIDKHIGKEVPAIFEKDKHIYANPDTLLIDDTFSKVDKFRKAGGKAIYFTDHRDLRLEKL